MFFNDCLVKNIKLGFEITFSTHDYESDFNNFKGVSIYTSKSNLLGYVTTTNVLVCISPFPITVI